MQNNELNKVYEKVCHEEWKSNAIYTHMHIHHSNLYEDQMKNWCHNLAKHGRNCMLEVGQQDLIDVDHCHEEYSRCIQQYEVSSLLCNIMILSAMLKNLATKQIKWHKNQYSRYKHHPCDLSKLTCNNPAFCTDRLCKECVKSTIQTKEDAKSQCSLNTHAETNNIC